jgi:hypothetical protein
MKRRIGRAAVLLATVTILFFYPFIAPPAHRIDETHFRMIKGGMTEAEVEGIFGVPAGEYDWAVAVVSNVWVVVEVVYFSDLSQSWGVAGQAQQQVHLFIDGGDRLPFPRGSWHSPNHREIKTWTSRHGAFQVVFDGQGRVAVTSSLGETRIEPPWNLWWRKWTGK